MPPVSLRRVHGSGEKDLSILFRSSHSQEEDLQDTDTLSSSTPVNLASGQAHMSPSPAVSAALPPFQAAFAPGRKAGRRGTEGENDRFLLYQIAEQYGLEGAVPGTPYPHTGELGRPSTSQEPDRLLLSQGAAVDLMASVNSHLYIPPLDAIPPDYQEVIASSRRRGQPLSSSGFKPIPMHRYSTGVSGLAAFLDNNPAPPVATNLPAPIFPPSLEFARYSTLSAVEGISAINILATLPEPAREARMKVMTHIARIFFASLNRSAEAVGSDLRAVRQAQLAGESQATRDELVHQPILSDQLYTDPSKIGTPVNDGPASPTEAFSSSSRRPSEVARIQPSPAYPYLTPSPSPALIQVFPGGAYNVAGTPDNLQPLDLSSQRDLRHLR